MFMFLMHDIVVLFTCCENMHGISQYYAFLPYIHSMGLIDYMMRSCFTWMRLSMFVLFMYEVHVKACSLLVGLLSMCVVMGLHMYIEIVGLDGDYE